MVRGVMRYLFVLSVLGACGGGGSSESLKVKIARGVMIHFGPWPGYLYSRQPFGPCIEM